MKNDTIYWQGVSKLEKEFLEFIDSQLPNMQEDTVFELLQSHGRMNDYCLSMAKKIKKYEQSLVVHSINKQNFKEALNHIDQIEDKEMRIESIVKFGRALINHEPTQYLRALQSPDFADIEKNKLVPILLQAPKNAFGQAAQLVTKFWI